MAEDSENPVGQDPAKERWVMVNGKKQHQILTEQFGWIGVTKSLGTYFGVIEDLKMVTYTPEEWKATVVMKEVQENDEGRHDD